MCGCPANKTNGGKYCEFVLVNVDDILSISEHPRKFIVLLSQPPFEYHLKDVGTPEQYLGAIIGYFTLDGCNGAMDTLLMSAESYLEKAIPLVEEHFGSLKSLFPKASLDTPGLPDRLELENSKFLVADEVTLYQSYIGILRWAIELG